MTSQSRTIVGRMQSGSWLLLTLLLLSPTLAQELPQAKLREDRIGFGKPLFLEATGLEPLTLYALSLHGPGQDTVEESLMSDEDGQLGYTTTLNTAGVWVLTFTGVDFEANLGLTVIPLEGTALVEGEAPGLVPGQTPQADPTEPLPPAVSTDLDFKRSGRELIARSGETVAWTLTFPIGAGPAGPLLRVGEVLLAGQGNSVLWIDPSSGSVNRRDILPAAVTDLSVEGSATRATVTFERGLTETLTLGEAGPMETVRFGPDPMPFTWLRGEAEGIDLHERIGRDPTNPWLAAGLAQNPELDQRSLIEQAINSAQTFYDLAGLARVAAGLNEPELVDLAMDLALSDFASRGYDPRLLTDLELHERYAFPLKPLQESLTRNDLQTASMWAEWLLRIASPEVSETRKALLEYAATLQAAGMRDEATRWRSSVRALDRPSLASGLDSIFLALGRIGWYAAAAILITFLALHLTLAFKYWIPQTVVLQRRKEAGRPANPLSRLLAIRFYSLTEKFVLTLLLLTCFCLALLASWADRSADLPASLRSGTLASATARLALARSQFPGPKASFLKGYAAHTAGDSEVAETAYEQAGDFAPAVNNLAALTNSEALYQRALDLEPGLREARYNLGRITSPLPFQETYRAGQPMLAAPTPNDLLVAWAGSWNGALAAGFTNPWSGLRDARPNWGSRTLWTAIVLLFLLTVASTLAWIVIPRPRLARNAPRSPLYHLLVVLIPGAGLADELWGTLLLIPWAVFGLDAISQLAGWNLGGGFEPNLNYLLLTAVYLVNLVAVIVEFISYQRRMTELRRNNPDVAKAFGLSPISES